jgi:hypothetical protein
VFSNAVVSGLRAALGFGPDVLDESVLLGRNPELIHQEIMRVGIHILVPAARSRLDTLDQAGWKRLATNLQSMWGDAERVLDRFGHRLEPREVELLLDIQQSLEGALTFWRTFPDLAGVPDVQLPKTKTPPELLKSGGYDSTAEELRKVLKYAQLLTAERNEGTEA